MNTLKKIRKFLFDQKNTQSLILRLSAIIPGFMIIMVILGLISPTVFRYVIPVALLILIVISAILLVLLMQLIKAIRLMDKNAVILSQGNLNISDIISEKTRALKFSPPPLTI